MPLLLVILVWEQLISTHSTESLSLCTTLSQLCESHCSWVILPPSTSHPPRKLLTPDLCKMRQHSYPLGRNGCLTTEGGLIITFDGHSTSMRYPNSHTFKTCYVAQKQTSFILQNLLGRRLVCVKLSVTKFLFFLSLFPSFNTDS